MDPAQLQRGLVIGAGALGLAAVITMAVGVSNAEVAPPEPFSVERAADRAPPPRTVREMPAAPRTPPPGAVIERESGLRTWDIQAGKGAPPKAGQMVAVDYTAWLDRGVVLETTARSFEPMRFMIGGRKVVPGLDEGVREMRVGGVRQLVVPAALAFGAEGVPNQVPPQATITYEVELVDMWDLPQVPTPVPPGAWRTLEHGVRAADLTVGKGAEITAGHTVTLDYTMWANGNPVATSLDRPAPMVARLGADQLLPGWDLAMIGMRVGGRRQIVLPPDQAFGSEGKPPQIPPGAKITVEVLARRVE